MSTHLEIETKAMLEEREYLLLLKDNQSITYKQINYYIDNSSYEISKNYGLRIREKDNKFELTLKITLGEGRLEVNQDLSIQEFSNFKNKNIFPNGEIKSYLISFKIDVSSLKIIGELITFRCDINYNSSLISIDKNEYNHLIDYEIECEDENAYKASQNLQEFLNINMIPFKENHVSKLQRFIESI